MMFAVPKKKPTKRRSKNRFNFFILQKRKLFKSFVKCTICNGYKKNHFSCLICELL